MDKTNTLYLCRGKAILKFDLQTERPDRGTIEKNMIGRTGNLRAPAIITGKTMIVGFNEDLYSRIFRIK